MIDSIFLIFVPFDAKVYISFKKQLRKKDYIKQHVGSYQNIIQYNIKTFKSLMADKLLKVLMILLTNAIVSYFFNVKRNSRPPSLRFRTVMVPEWNATALRTMLKPKPVPPQSRVRPSVTR